MTTTPASTATSCATRDAACICAVGASHCRRAGPQRRCRRRRDRPAGCRRRRRALAGVRREVDLLDVAGLLACWPRNAPRCSVAGSPHSDAAAAAGAISRAHRDRTCSTPARMRVRVSTWHGAACQRRDLLHAGPLRALRCRVTGEYVGWAGAVAATDRRHLSALLGADSFDRGHRARPARRRTRLRLPRRRHDHALKHLLGRPHCPPWQRERLPLLSAADGTCSPPATASARPRWPAGWTRAARGFNGQPWRKLAAWPANPPQRPMPRPSPTSGSRCRRSKTSSPTRKAASSPRTSLAAYERGVVHATPLPGRAGTRPVARCVLSDPAQPGARPPVRRRRRCLSRASWRGARGRGDAGPLLPDSAASPARLHAAMRHGVLNGGKRMRPPLLAYATGTAFGVDDDALDARCRRGWGVHCYSLVHDDLPAMDDDSLRRGLDRARRLRQSHRDHAGDALQALAF